MPKGSHFACLSVWMWQHYWKVIVMAILLLETCSKYNLALLQWIASPTLVWQWRCRWAQCPQLFGMHWVRAALWEKWNFQQHCSPPCWAGHSVSHTRLLPSPLHQDHARLELSGQPGDKYNHPMKATNVWYWNLEVSTPESGTHFISSILRYLFSCFLKNFKFPETDISVTINEPRPIKVIMITCINTYQKCTLLKAYISISLPACNDDSGSKWGQNLRNALPQSRSTASDKGHLSRKSARR